MSAQTPDESKLMAIVLAALDIDDVTPDEVHPDAPLFDLQNENSLGLDSIDALEISLAIAKEYDVQLEAENEDNKEIFYSLRSLTNYILTNQ